MMWDTSRYLSDTETAQFAEANNLNDVAWVATTPHGILVGTTKGQSRLHGDPAPCRPMTLKRKYRQS
jgi:hypothetical protein